MRSKAQRELTPEERAWDAAAKTPGAALPEPSPAAPAAPLVAAPADSGLTPALEDMVSRAMPAIVLVETTSGRGSAFFVQHDTLITNVHVVQQDGYVTLRRMDGSSVSARVQTRAPAFDIAILKVAQGSASQPFLPMGTSQSLKPGQEVVVIGSALGTLQNSVSRGIVSGLRNSGGVTLVQSDAAANPGNSGGPMLDRNGRVVGILTAGYSGQQGLNFAVSIDHARDILEGRQTNLGSTDTGLASIQPTPGGRVRRAIGGNSRVSRNSTNVWPQPNRRPISSMITGSVFAATCFTSPHARFVRARVVRHLRARRDPRRFGSRLHRLLPDDEHRDE